MIRLLRHNRRFGRWLGVWAAILFTLVNGIASAHHNHGAGDCDDDGFAAISLAASSRQHDGAPTAARQLCGAARQSAPEFCVACCLLTHTQATFALAAQPALAPAALRWVPASFDTGTAPILSRPRLPILGRAPPALPTLL